MAGRFRRGAGGRPVAQDGYPLLSCCECGGGGGAANCWDYAIYTYRPHVGCSTKAQSAVLSREGSAGQVVTVGPDAYGFTYSTTLHDTGGVWEALQGTAGSSIQSWLVMSPRSGAVGCPSPVLVPPAFPYTLPRDFALVRVTLSPSGAPSIDLSAYFAPGAVQPWIDTYGWTPTTWEIAGGLLCGGCVAIGPFGAGRVVGATLISCNCCGSGSFNPCTHVLTTNSGLATFELRLSRFAHADDPILHACESGQFGYGLFSSGGLTSAMYSNCIAGNCNVSMCGGAALC